MTVTEPKKVPNIKFASQTEMTRKIYFFTTKRKSLVCHAIRTYTVYGPLPIKIFSGLNILELHFMENGN